MEASERLWSAGEIETVRRMKADGHKLSRIAARLGRSYDGVRGISRRFPAAKGRGPASLRAWSAREIAYLEAAAARGDSLECVAGHLRRSRSSVKKFAWRRDLSLAADREREQAKERPADWGMVAGEAARREQVWAGCRFEDAPAACRPEARLVSLELGVAPLGVRRDGSPDGAQPTLPALPSEMR